MSELKVYIAPTPDGTGLADYYLKSEVDKVIAEQKDKLQNVSELLTEAREWLIESQKMHKRCADDAIKKIRHHKYKRCLAMARWCRVRACYYLTMGKNSLYWDWKSDRAYKWHRRWLELAEKFKEAK